MMPQVTVNALDLEFIPTTLVARDKQLKEIENIVVNTAYSSENIWISGGPGLGKTLTVRFFAKHVMEERHEPAFYMACEKSMRNSIDKVRHQYHLPMTQRELSGTGFGAAIIKRYPNLKYYFIIDEPDKVYAKVDITGFVHSLWNYLIEENAKFSFIFVSKLDVSKAASLFQAKDTMSRLQLKPIIFPVYDAKEIVAILRQRLDLVIDNYKYDLAALFQLAHHIRRTTGDMRQALEILREAIRISQNQMISSQVIGEAVEWGKRTWWTRRLRSIPPHWAIIVYLAAKKCKENKTLVIDEPDVIKLYNEAMADLQIEPVSPSTVYFIIKQVSGASRDIEPFFEHKLEKWGCHAQVHFEESERDHIVSVGETLDWKDLLAFGA
jgi:Cdc6-like AAA superfamily ATPase